MPLGAARTGMSKRLYACVGYTGSLPGLLVLFPCVLLKCALRNVSPLLTLRLLHRTAQEPESRQRCLRACRNLLQASAGTVLGLLLEMKLQGSRLNSECTTLPTRTLLGADRVFPTLPQMMLPSASGVLVWEVLILQR